MFKATKVLGTPFEEAIRNKTVESISDEMYICTMGIIDNIVGATIDEVRSKALSHHQGINNNLVFSLHDSKVLLSDVHKYYVNVRYAFFHLMLDTLMSIFYIQENDPDAVFIVNAPEFCVDGWQDRDKSIDFLLEMFKLNEIKFYFIGGYRRYQKTFGIENVSSLSPEPVGNSVKQTIEVPIYRIKNFTVVDESISRAMSYKDLANLSEKYIVDRYPVNSKFVNQKVYVSRGGSAVQGEAFKEAGNPDSGYDDIEARIYEERLIEDYLRSIGFRIFNANETYSILDQIKIMRGANVLVGTTGSGLVNAIFLNKNCTLVELIVELANEKSSATVVDYWHLSQAKDHTYIGIDLIDKQGSTAVEKLKSLFEALDLNKLN